MFAPEALNAIDTTRVPRTGKAAKVSLLGELVRERAEFVARDWQAGLLDGPGLAQFCAASTSYYKPCAPNSCSAAEC